MQIAGSHDLKGDVKVSLDTEAARAALESMKGRVDAVAVTGHLSVRNPEHEEKVAELAEEILGRSGSSGPRTFIRPRVQ